MAAFWGWGITGTVEEDEVEGSRALDTLFIHRTISSTSKNDKSYSFQIHNIIKRLKIYLYSKKQYFKSISTERVKRMIIHEY